MFFLKKKKIRNQKINETKEKMKELFLKKVKDYEDYQLLYGYSTILEKNGYSYQNKIIAYRVSDMSLIVLYTDKDFTKAKHLFKFKKGGFKSASYSKVKDIYSIRRSELKSDKEEFTIVLKNYEDEDVLAYINQEDCIDDFNDFFMEFKKNNNKIKK